MSTLIITTSAACGLAPTPDVVFNLFSVGGMIITVLAAAKFRSAKGVLIFFTNPYSVKKWGWLSVVVIGITTLLAISGILAVSCAT